MRGAIVDMPGRYPGEIAVIQEMGWSWPDLCAAPADMVEEIAERMNARARWQGEKEKLDAAKQRQKDLKRGR